MGWLCLVEVVGSESMIMYQAASNFFPYNQPLCIVFLSGAKDLAVMSLYCLDSTKETHHPNLDILFDQFPMFALQTDRFKIVVCE